MTRYWSLRCRFGTVHMYQAIGGAVSEHLLVDVLFLPKNSANFISANKEAQKITGALYAGPSWPYQWPRSFQSPLAESGR